MARALRRQLCRAMRSRKGGLSMRRITMVIFAGLFFLSLAGLAEAQQPDLSFQRSLEQLQQQQQIDQLQQPSNSAGGQMQQQLNNLELNQQLQQLEHEQQTAPGMNSFGSGLQMQQLEQQQQIDQLHQQQGHLPR